MAAVLPTVSTNCIGTFQDGTAHYQLKCQKTVDDEGNPIYICLGAKMQAAQCNNGINRKCSNVKSIAFLPSITRCLQRMYA